MNQAGSKDTAATPGRGRPAADRSRGTGSTAASQRAGQVARAERHASAPALRQDETGAIPPDAAVLHPGRPAWRPRSGAAPAGTGPEGARAAARLRASGRAGRLAGLAFGLLALLGLPALAQTATHSYRPAATGAPSQAAQALAGQIAGEARLLELMAAGEEQPLARAEVAELPDGGRQLLGWRALTPAPILRRDIRAEEELALVEALRAHLPDGSQILAMPEESRRLARLIDASVPLAAEAEPLAMPAPWSRQGAEVAAVEAEEWGAPAADGITGEALTAFVDALLAEDRNGAARLRVLAGPRETYVLVNLDDAFQLGLWRPGRMEIVQRVLASSDFSHDMAAETRRLTQEEGAAAWAVGRSGDGALRAHFLLDDAETATLIAQLLPFNTSQLDRVPGLRLVWGREGTWLYRLDDLELPGN